MGKEVGMIKPNQIPDLDSSDSDPDSTALAWSCDCRRERVGSGVRREDIEDAVVLRVRIDRFRGAGPPELQWEEHNMHVYTVLLTRRTKLYTVVTSFQHTPLLLLIRLNPAP